MMPDTEALIREFLLESGGANLIINQAVPSAALHILLP